MWTVVARGGAFDGVEGETWQTPPDVMIVWRDADGVHATFDARNRRIVLRTAVAYRRVARSCRYRKAVYRLGPVAPEAVVEILRLANAARRKQASS